MWDQLPELILTQIFDYLDCHDRTNVDQTCQAWSRVLAMPILWRSITIIIDKDLRDDFPSAKDLMIKYGQHMRKLELSWSRPYVSQREIRVTSNFNAELGVDFLIEIQSKNVQLTELFLTNWFFGTNWIHRSKLLHALAHYLKCQQKLELLSLINANLAISDVLRVLRATSWSCGNTLKYLDIRGAFKDWQAPYSNSRYLKYLSRLNALTTFQLDYSALSDHTLNCLARAAPKILKTLHISIRDSDSRQHTISDSVWYNLVAACPQLTVSYTIINISHFEDVSSLLLPSVPLVYFHMYGGRVWDQSRSRNFRSTVGLLINHYTNTLTEVMLQLRNNRERLDDLLLLMLQRCKHLAKLQYDGIIRSLDILRDICQLQMDCKTNFSTIHVKPRNINTQNRAILDDIGYQYNRQLLNRDIDFRVEDPVSALHFY